MVAARVAADAWEIVSVILAGMMADTGCYGIDSTAICCLLRLFHVARQTDRA